jgi:hypothetical protein
MGQAIVYCFKCGIRLRDSDADSGFAVLYKERMTCARCIAELMPELPEAERDELRRRLESVTRRTPSPRRPATTKARMVAVATPPPQSGVEKAARRLPPILIWGGAGAAVFLAVLILLAVSGRSEPPSKAPVPKAAPSPAEPPLSKLVERARAYELAHPDDLAGQIRLDREALWEAEGTPAFEELKNSIDLKLQRRRGQLEFEAARVERAARDDWEAGRFPEAAERIARERRRTDETDWTALVDRLAGELDRAIADAFRAARETAQDARRQGNLPEVERIRRQVASWGRPALSQELERALDEVTPRLPRDDAPPK